MLELKHLCFEAETDDGVRQILKDVSLTVDERMVVITGPNGSGKSTMAKLIAGIEQPTSGQILLVAKHRSNIRRLIEHKESKLSFKKDLSDKFDDEDF